MSAVVTVGGCDRIGGYNMPYVEAYDPVEDKWTALAKLPAFTKSEYAVAAYRFVDCFFLCIYLLKLLHLISKIFILNAKHIKYLR